MAMIVAKTYSITYKNRHRKPDKERLSESPDAVVRKRAKARERERDEERESKQAKESKDRPLVRLADEERTDMCFWVLLC